MSNRYCAHGPRLRTSHLWQVFCEAVDPPTGGRAAIDGPTHHRVAACAAVAEGSSSCGGYGGKTLDRRLHTAAQQPRLAANAKPVLEVTLAVRLDQGRHQLALSRDPHRGNWESKRQSGGVPDFVRM